MITDRNQVTLEINIPKLQYLVITDSFTDESGVFKELEFTLWARLSKFKYCEIYFTESSEVAAISIMKRYDCAVGQLYYANEHIVFKTASFWSVCGYIRESEYTELNTLDKFVRDTIFSLGFQRANFVVVSDTKFNNDLWGPIRHSGKLVSSKKAIQNLRVNLVRYGIYEAYIDGESRVGGAEWMYLTYRLRTVFPGYQVAWECTCNVGSINSKEREILSSLGHRLEFLLKTIDALIYNSMQPKTASAIVNLNYHFTYFMLLATGCFDSIAWLCNTMYNINHFNRNQVTINGGKNSKFIEKIRATNGSLTDFLSSDETQNRIGVFYPFRDSLMHREILQPLQIGGAKEDSALIIDSAMLGALRALSEDDKSWGIEYGNHVVSSVFIPKIIEHFIKLYNEILELFDWLEFMRKESQLSDIDIRKITDQDHESFWKRYNFSEKPLFW